MSLRLATLLAAATVLLGGCAQSNFDAIINDTTEFAGLINDNASLPVDVIYDAPTQSDRLQPTQVAWETETVGGEGTTGSDWGTATVTPSAPVKTAALGDAAEAIHSEPVPLSKDASRPAEVQVADGWHAPPRRMISPAPVGPPPGAPPPVAWGPAVVVSADITGGPTGFEPYILDTGDRLRVFVYGQPNLSRLYIVDQVGNIAVPLIGTVRARGRTTVDLERTIAARLGREFVKDPQVTVDVAQNRPFFILGEVRLPGQYPFVSGMTIEQAVAIGGGFTERASKRSYRITRKLGALVDQIEAPGDYPLCPGDTVYVFERWF